VLIRGPNWWTWIIVCGRYTLISLGNFPRINSVYISYTIMDKIYFILLAGMTT